MKHNTPKRGVIYSDTPNISIHSWIDNGELNFCEKCGLSDYTEDPERLATGKYGKDGWIKDEICEGGHTHNFQEIPSSKFYHKNFKQCDECGKTKLKPMEELIRNIEKEIFQIRQELEIPIKKEQGEIPVRDLDTNEINGWEKIINK